MPDLDLLNPKPIDFDSVGDYYCAKFQVIPIRSFRFIVLTYPPTHSHYTHIVTEWSLYGCRQAKYCRF